MRPRRPSKIPTGLRLCARGNTRTTMPVARRGLGRWGNGWVASWAQAQVRRSLQQVERTSISLPPRVSWVALGVQRLENRFLPTRRAKHALAWWACLLTTGGRSMGCKAHGALSVRRSSLVMLAGPTRRGWVRRPCGPTISWPSTRRRTVYSSSPLLWNFQAPRNDSPFRLAILMHRVNSLRQRSPGNNFGGYQALSVSISAPAAVRAREVEPDRAIFPMAELLAQQIRNGEVERVTVAAPGYATGGEMIRSTLTRQEAALGRSGTGSAAGPGETMRRLGMGR